MQHYLVRDKHLQRCARIIRTDATNLPPIYVHHCHHSSHVFHLTLDKSSAFVFWYLLSRLLASLGHLSCAPEFFWFLLRDAMHSADCVCLSVRYYIKIAKCRQTFLSIGQPHYCSFSIPNVMAIFGCGPPRNVVVESKGHEKQRFSTNISLYLGNDTSQGYGYYWM